MKFSRR